MLPRIHNSKRHESRIGRAHRRLRRQVLALRQDLDCYEQAFADWKQNRPLRHQQTDVRLHVIEAQLARLKGCDTMETSCLAALPTPASRSHPDVIPIGAYLI